MLIRCTQKLLAEIGVDLKSLVIDSLEPNKGAIEEWYANLVIIERQKCIVFMNASTHFVTLSFGKKKREIQQFRELFVNSLANALESEAVDSEIIEKFLATCETVSLGKTIDRSVLGYMNDVIHMAQYLIPASQEQNRGEIDLGNVTKQLNRSPWVKARHTYAIDGMQELMQRDLNWDGQFTP
jgi:hypothetical protein